MTTSLSNCVSLFGAPFQSCDFRTWNRERRSRYHSYCTPSDGTCPKCSSGALPKLSLKARLAGGYKCC